MGRYRTIENVFYINLPFEHVFCPLQNSVAQLPLEELDRIQEYLQTSGLAQR